LFPSRAPCGRVFISCVPWQNSSFIYEWEMLQATNVKCRVFKWATTIVSEKCLKLQVWGFKLQVWGVEFLNEQVWRS
jgi:hypothetical protein